jgi:filamentous hemagglutinin
MSQDPGLIGHIAGATFHRLAHAPQSLNSYTYAANNPTRFVDPTGESFITAALSFFEGLGEIVKGNLTEGRKKLGEAKADFWQSAGVYMADTTQILGDKSDIEKAEEAAGKAIQAGNMVVEAVGFASTEQREDHFQRHGGDLGDSTDTEYENNARDFLTGPRSETTQEKVRSNGDRVRYDPKTEKFGVISSDGTTIKTFFKPDPDVHGRATNQDYFNDQ